MTKESSLISNVWTQRSLGVDLSKGLGSITAATADIEYLCNYVYPFLQLVNVDAVFAEEAAINFITASTGWIIHDYGDAISVAAPHDPKIKINEVSGDNNEDKAKISHITGGVLGQITTVSEIAKLVAEKGWAAVEVIAGTQMMQRFIWIESKRYNFELRGYIPNSSDEKCYERLVKQAKSNDLVWEKHVEISNKVENNVVGAE